MYTYYHWLTGGMPIIQTSGSQTRLVNRPLRFTSVQISSLPTMTRISVKIHRVTDRRSVRRSNVPGLNLSESESLQSHVERTNGFT